VLPDEPEGVDRGHAYRDAHSVDNAVAR
jgi:hypothetical protein